MFYVTFTRKIYNFPTHYTINGLSLLKMNKVKDLGMLFDSELSFVEHIENLALSAFKSLGFLMRVSRYFDNPQLIKSLYFVFIVSKLEYYPLTIFNFIHSTLTVYRVVCRETVDFRCKRYIETFINI